MGQADIEPDYSICAAYFLVISGGLDSIGRDGSEYKKFSSYAFDQASQLTNKKITAKKMSLSYKEMLKALDGDWSNSEILIDKYGYACLELIDPPPIKRTPKSN
jgi:hypothetical protein